MNLLGLVASIYLIQFIHFCKACNGISVEVKSVAYGKSNNLIIEKEIQTDLTDDCLLKINACFNITRSFKKARVSYRASKKFIIKSEPLTVQVKDRDLCSILEKLRIECSYPISGPTRICSDVESPINVRRYKNYLKLAKGETSVHAKIVYDDDDEETDADTIDMVLNVFKKEWQYKEDL